MGFCMKSNKKHLKWLSGELPHWQEQGIITSDNAEKVRSLYQVSPTTFPLTIVIFAVFGAIMIGGGLIMIFGHNWDLLSRGVKVGLAFSLVLVGQGLAGFTLWKNKGIHWREGSAVFLNLSLLAGISIVAQVYQLGGNLEKLLFVWLILSWPTCYLLKSRAATVIYLATLPIWVGNYNTFRSINQVGSVFKLIIVTLPITWIVVKSWLSYYQELEERLLTVVSFLSLLIVASHFFDKLYDINIGLFFLVVTICVLIFAIKVLEQHKCTIRNNPLVIFSGGIVGTFLLIISFKDNFRVLSLGKFNTESVIPWLNIAIAVLMSIYGIYLLVRKRVTVASLAFLPILVLIGILFLDHLGIVMLIFNIYLILLAVLIILQGRTKKQSMYSFIGVFWLSTLVYARFIDSDLSMVGKGVAFIIIGILFLAINIFLSKEIKKEVSYEA